MHQPNVSEWMNESTDCELLEFSSKERQRKEKLLAVWQDREREHKQTNKQANKQADAFNLLIFNRRPRDTKLECLLAIQTFTWGRKPD